MTNMGETRQPGMIRDVFALEEVQVALGRTMILPDEGILTARREVVEDAASLAGESVRLALVSDRAISMMDESSDRIEPAISFRPRLNTMSPLMSVVQILVLRNVFGYEEPLPIPRLTRLAGFELVYKDRLNTLTRLKDKATGARALLQETVVRDYSTFAIHPLVVFQAAEVKPPIRIKRVPGND